MEKVQSWRDIGSWHLLGWRLPAGQTLVDVTPQSSLAKLLVGTEMLLCLGWAVVVALFTFLWFHDWRIGGIIGGGSRLGAGTGPACSHEDGTHIMP